MYVFLLVVLVAILVTPCKHKILCTALFRPSMQKLNHKHACNYCKLIVNIKDSYLFSSYRCLPEMKYFVRGWVLLTHWILEFIKHVFPRLLSPVAPFSVGTETVRTASNEQIIFSLYKPHWLLPLYCMLYYRTIQCIYIPLCLSILLLFAINDISSGQLMSLLRTAKKGTVPIVNEYNFHI